MAMASTANCKRLPEGNTVELFVEMRLYLAIAGRFPIKAHVFGEVSETR